MAMIQLKAQPLTREAFAPFGDVIETEGAQHFTINAGATERFHDLARVEVLDGWPLINIFRALQVTKLPFQIKLVERHPLGSQAFIPLSASPFLVVVVPPGDGVDPRELRAFISNGRQGVNYHRGVWHHPLMALAANQDFLVVDRGGPGPNCDEFHFENDEIVLMLYSAR